jgi:hypothetical protein
MATCHSDRAVVYVLCFSRPFHGANGRHPGARHYVGIAEDGDAQRRLTEHLAGQGSPLVKSVVRAGITVEIATVVPAIARWLAPLPAVPAAGPRSTGRLAGHRGRPAARAPARTPR